VDWFPLLRELTELPGPSGQEDEVMAWVEARWSDRCQETQRTTTGNVLARVGGLGPRLLIQAHADEIGFVVRSIHKDGFVHLATAQRADDPFRRFPVGQVAMILGRDGPVDGIIAALSGHVLTAEQRGKKKLDYPDIFVDVGASSRSEAERMGIHPGARVIWNPPLRRLGTRLYGKAMDDRMPLALMTALIEQVADQDLAYELHLGVTIQEENGLIGANAIPGDLRPDLALAVDVGLAGDVPGVSDQTMPTALGAGPVLVHKDASVHYSRALIWKLVGLAEARSIPFQHAIFEQYGSDGAEFIRHGIPTALIAPPTRYTHSPFEMVDERDLDATLDLLVAFVTERGDGPGTD
jgi:tetrahedral aminopeptidase